MIDISNLNNKTQNKGADESGRLAASEWNTLVSAVEELQGSASESISYEEQELTEEQQAQVRTNIGAGTYSKPSDGIPASDLASGVVPDTSQFIDKDVNNLTNYTKTSDLSSMLNSKQDVIQDLSTIRSGAAAGATAIQPAALSTKQDTISDLDTIRSGAAAGATAVQPSELSAKQDVLVDSGAGQNIKTINQESILGSGDIIVQAGVGFDSISTPSTTDGTALITLTNGDTITLDLNHQHTQYAKYVYCASQAAYDAIATKESDTIYLILETS